MRTKERESNIRHQTAVARVSTHLIDFGTINWLEKIKLQSEHLFVWLSTFNPHMAFILDNLACVDGRIELAETTRDAVVFDLPPEVRKGVRACLNRNIDSDVRPPGRHYSSELADSWPSPRVLVSGCFDLIHAGHVELIREACAFGAVPIVAMLTTDAIRHQPKNANRRRPLWSMAERLSVVEALRFKTKPVFFDGPDCIRLIHEIRPDVYVKSYRDKGRRVVEVEAALVESLGGKVVWLQSTFPECSSTSIVEALGMTQGGS